jgi:lipopolysaccharide export system protein LptA
MILAHVFLGAIAWASDDTVIKGGKMELINKGEEVVFSHGVKMEQGTDTLTANTMRTSNNRDKITADGDVRLLRKVSSTETWHGSGEKGFYDASGGMGYLLGGKKRAAIKKVEVLTSTITRVMELWGDRIDFMRESKLTKATGHVEGKTTDPKTSDEYEFTSENAVYDGKTKILVLSGERNSSVVQKGKENKRQVWGRTITYYVDSNRMVSDGSAQAVMENRAKASSPNKEKK